MLWDDEEFSENVKLLMHRDDVFTRGNLGVNRMPNIPGGNSMFNLCDKMRTLSLKVWTKEWDVPIDCQGSVETACIEGLEWIYDDVHQWISVPSEDKADSKTLKIGAETVEYEE